MKVTPEDFKDGHGRWRTQSLFMETNTDEKKYGSIFTLKDEDRKGRISMRRIYLEANDPTEYMAAMDLFGSVACWNNLKKTTWFKPHLARWRTELQTRIRSRAIAVIDDAAQTGTVTGTQLNAAKWLATQNWEEDKPKKQGPGRPPKVMTVSERLKEALNEEENFEEDYKRLKL